MYRGNKRKFFRQEANGGLDKQENNSEPQETVDINFSDVIMQSIQPALIAGIKLDEFWEYTLVEILMICEAYKEKQKQEKQIDAFIHYRSVALMQYTIASVFSDKKDIQFPSLQEQYSILFDYDETVQQGEQQDYRVMKERLLEFADLNNRKYQTAGNE